MPGEDAAGKYTPTRLAKELKTQLTKYIEGAYPLSDTTLIKARRALLHSAEDGRLLAQDPFVETTPRYRGFSGGYRDLGLGDDTAAFFDDLTRQQGQGGRPILYPGLYAHQAEALRSTLRDGKDIIVATGTGSGKTECFLLPMLGMLHEEARGRPERFQQRGVRCLILYPMNALVNDQMARLRLLLGDEAVAQRFRDLPAGRHATFGMYTGRTPYPGPRSAQKDEDRVRPILDYYLGLSPQMEQRLRQLGRYPANGLLVCEQGQGLLIDTAWTDAQTARLLDLAAARGCPVGALVVTHGHDDRMGGIGEARRRGLRTYAGAETAARAPRGAFDEALPKPAEEIHAGPITAEVFFPGPAHTRDNVVVWLPSSKVLFGGCMVRAASGKTLGNVAEADVAAWPDAVRAVMDRYGQAAAVVPGHGDPGGPELLAHTLALALAARPR